MIGPTLHETWGWPSRSWWGFYGVPIVVRTPGHHQCYAASPPTGAGTARCTRRFGHTGRHHATGVDEILAVWP